MRTADLVLEDDLVQRLPTEACTRVIEIADVASGKGTLEELFENETLKTAATTDGEFSKPQLAAINATASIMQDKLIGLLGGMVAILHEQIIRGDKQLEEAIENNKSAVVQFLSREIFCGVTPQPPALNNNDEDDPNDSHIKKQNTWALLTWGNFLGIAALVLAAVAALTTHAYSNYKDLAALRKERIEEKDIELIQFRADLEKMRDERDAERSEKVMKSTLADSYKLQLEEAKSQQGTEPNGLQQQLDKVREDLTDWKVKEARATESLKAMKDKRDLYKSNFEAQQRKAINLQKEVDQLNEYITSLRNAGYIR